MCWLFVVFRPISEKIVIFEFHHKFVWDFKEFFPRFFHYVRLLRFEWKVSVGKCIYFAFLHFVLLVGRDRIEILCICDSRNWWKNSSERFVFGIVVIAILMLSDENYCIWPQYFEAKLFGFCNLSSKQCSEKERKWNIKNDRGFYVA